MTKTLFFLCLAATTNSIFSSVDLNDLMKVLENQNQLLASNPNLFNNNNHSAQIQSEKGLLLNHYLGATGRFMIVPGVITKENIDDIIENRRTMNNIQAIQQVNLNMQSLNGCITRLTELLQKREKNKFPTREDGRERLTTEEDEEKGKRIHLGLKKRFCEQYGHIAGRCYCFNNNDNNQN